VGLWGCDTLSGMAAKPTQRPQPSHAEVTAANVMLHARAAASYDSEEPHFRPESVARVREILIGLKAPCEGRMLDIGCGTGFLSRAADGLFSEIVGVDVTPEMVEIARTHEYTSRASFHVSDVMSFTPPHDHFDLVAGYAFLHHLADPFLVLERAMTWVRPGGFLYFDLEPNRGFWNALSEAISIPSPSPALSRELRSLNVQLTAEKYLVSEDAFNLAEYGKNILGGLDLVEISTFLKERDFVNIRPLYHWFIGEAHLLQTDSAEGVREYVRTVLVDALPISAPLFKYIGFSCQRAEV
jgi:2-polyprenyl-3-methyl-5-hydroxy-6-metoxy-1,4-benzoquinol methylase